MFMRQPIVILMDILSSEDLTQQWFAYYHRQVNKPVVIGHPIIADYPLEEAIPVVIGGFNPTVISCSSIVKVSQNFGG
jgi:hypothetical protein